MPDEDKNILESKPGKKSLKHAFVICFDLECSLLKMNTCDNNPKKSYTIAKELHKSSGYSLVTRYSFDKYENEQTYYRGEDPMKRFCDELKDHVNRTINYEMKSVDPFTAEEKHHMKTNNYVIYAKRNFVLIKVIKKNTN